MTAGKRNALGRGLEALIPGPGPSPGSGPDRAGPGAATAGPRRVGVEQLRPNPEQPRARFEPGALRALAASLERHGLLQPIVVSRDGEAPGSFVIIAGERRWRAAQLAGLTEVPVVIREAEADDRLELAIVENLQREDLNPIEEARALARLMQLKGLTHEQLAARVGRDRSTVSNSLRLLKLPEKVQAMVEEGVLSMGHARALLGLASDAAMIALATEAVRAGLSVRALEREVRRRAAEEAREPREPDDEQRRRQAIVSDLQERMRRALGVRVRLKTSRRKKGAGVIEVPYGDLDELDRILKVMIK